MANYEATPSPTTTADFPGKTLGLVGLILAIVAPVVGIIVSAVALSPVSYTHLTLPTTPYV